MPEIKMNKEEMNVEMQNMAQPSTMQHGHTMQQHMPNMYQTPQMPQMHNAMYPQQQPACCPYYSSMQCPMLYNQYMMGNMPAANPCNPNPCNPNPCMNYHMMGMQY